MAEQTVDPGTAATNPPNKGGGMVRLLIVGGITLYVAYIAWSFFLMAFLPRPAGTFRWMVSLGMMTALIFGLIFIAIGSIGFIRVKEVEDIDDDVRKMALIKIALAIGPGLLLSIATPLMIIREPILSIVVSQPSNPDDLIAPVPVTFSLEEAIAVLARYDLRALKYEWDFEGDKKINQQTVVPTVTAVYDREGVYYVTARITLTNNSTRKAALRLVIQRAAVALFPPTPIEEKPVILSLSHLVDSPQSIVQIEWDFESDGNIDEVTKTPDTSFTYYRRGRYTITAIMRLQNNSQTRYQRSFEVRPPPPLPFPVNITSEPRRLIGPPPFSVVFRVETNEPVSQIQWSFGDRTKAEGTPAAHTYEAIGTYPVETKIRSVSGSLAEIVNVVLVGEELQIGDLTFEGSHKVEQGRIEGEVPLQLNLLPKSSLRNVDYEWEAPDATEIGSTKTQLQAVYRKTGVFTIILVAEDAEHRAMRLPMKIIVRPPISEIDFELSPSQGIAPLSVIFDASLTYLPNEEITGFQWSFGDDTAGAKKFVPGPAFMSYRYEKPGAYEITLRVLTKTGKRQEIVKTLVVREALLRACAEVSRLSGSVPLQIRFNAECSTGATTYEWDFGDGAQATGKTVDHIFEKPAPEGLPVTLIIRSSDGREHKWLTTISPLQ